ncbi:MAG: putative peptide zinc metalloprotease protein [Candidatus Pelagisphaera sp.]|jgi:putative peptide zinc metalloprotease protein
MPETPSTYSESWFRIAQQRVCLRAHVTVRRQFFRGERWYVLQDNFNNQFFRVRPEAYDFLVRLHTERTVDSVWNECFHIDPDSAPGQEEVLRLLAQLYGANLLHSSLAPDSVRLFERYTKRKQRERKAFFRSIMFARIPLFDPDNFLKRAMPVAKALFSWFGFIVLLVVIGAAGKVVIDNFGELKNQAEGVLAPSNLLFLYVGLIIIKSVHEFGHAFACRRFGGEVHTMGVMFLLFTPIPYMDATASWSFRSRWQRALVGAAGMIVEMFVASIAAFVWVNTGPGTLHSLAYNMMFVASVSTVLFNANPLLRFDGYYILSDLLDIPNLHQRSSGLIKHGIEYYAFGYKKSTSPARSRKEGVWLAVFAVASWIYKIIIFTSILLFLADSFLILGIIMALVCGIAWICVPIYKLVVYLSSSPKLDRTRFRAVSIVVGFIVGLMLILDVIPFPSRFRSPGVLQVEKHTVVVAEVSGRVEEMLIADGERVVAGQPLLRLSSRDLELKIESAEAQLDETTAMQRRALRESTADLKSLESRAEVTRKLLSRLREYQDALVVTASHEGLWVAPGLRDTIGSWLERGSPVGQLVDQSSFYFSAIVSQNDASRLFSREISGSEIKLFGQTEGTLKVTSQKVIPGEQRNLPSASVGWAGGGEVAVDMSDQSGTKTTEPFFEVRASVSLSDEVSLLHGRGGKIRFDLPSEPLLSQWIRKFRQLLQNRYGI